MRSLRFGVRSVFHGVQSPSGCGIRIVGNRVSNADDPVFSVAAGKAQGQAQMEKTGKGNINCCYYGNDDAIKYMWAILKLDGKFVLKSDIEFLKEKLSEELLKKHYKKLEKIRK